MSSSPKEKVDYFMFGPYRISSDEIFLKTTHLFAFVNLRLVVPGHVLVCSKQVVPRFVDLTDEEVIDLWTIAKRVGAKIEPHYGAGSLTFGIQDGVYAGKEGDFEILDEVYDELDRKERELKKHLDAEAERKDATLERDREIL
ncbi:hypothetical protein KP509_20G055900 [Ceratopteris richardii]|uniref:HIT domain-containing protein n=1 Tax=Ceratopteris richardii TaxID=49495 RepID=A0A8T2SJ22_CERRI|nr:hypothetical protein KP509_20G055900 [Ceratopteris richardii]